ncbi:MAG: CAP domain-containing protein [Planctomycetota bacterium]|jgi:uncharacterized protein YkwD
MKNKHYALFLVIAAILAFACTGCGKKKSSDDIPTGTGTLTWPNGTGTNPTGTGTKPTGTGTTPTGTGTTSTGTGTTPTGTGTTSTGTGTYTGTSTWWWEDVGIKDRIYLDTATMLQLINQKRATAGSPALTLDAKVDAVCDAYGEHLMDKCAYAYTPDRDGKTPEERLIIGGCTFVECAETGVVKKMKEDYAYTMDKPDVAIKMLNQSVLTDARWVKAGVCGAVWRWNC